MFLSKRQLEFLGEPLGDMTLPKENGGYVCHGGVFGKGNSTPPAPDYAAAAQQTAAGNLEAARAAAAANRVNQYTPYGNLVYSHSGSDPDSGWSATQTLSPAQQQILDKNNQLNNGLLNTANSGLNYANEILSKPGVDTSKLASVGIDPGQSYQDAIMSRLQPQIEQENAAFDQKMANQGIAPGTEAYDNAKRNLAQQQNDRQVSATVNGFNTGLAARQQGFQESAYNQMQPINVINALRTGSQVTNPNFVNVPQQATTAGADMLGATQAGYNSQLAANNAANSSSNSLMGGLFGLGGSALMSPAGTFSGLFSDVRLKENIEHVGYTNSGIPIYTYNYIGSDVPQMGTMAHEVEKKFPDAVATHESGFKMVDYSKVQ